MNLTKQYNNKKKDAKKKGLVFDLSYSQYQKIWKGNKCYYTDKLLSEEEKSIDRIDSSIGYTVANSVLCDKTLNVAKGNLTKEQIYALNERVNSQTKRSSESGENTKQV